MQSIWGRKQEGVRTPDESHSSVYAAMGALLTVHRDGSIPRKEELLSFGWCSSSTSGPWYVLNKLRCECHSRGGVSSPECDAQGPRGKTKEILKLLIPGSGCTSDDSSFADPQNDYMAFSQRHCWGHMGAHGA